jgi:adenosylhomocysteine nucleosidase
MQTDIILITALADELNAKKLPRELKIFYSGAGKINATMTTMRAIQECQPRLIVNFGTAGSIQPACTGLLGINRVIQRDMMTEPLAPRGRVPFCPHPHEYFSDSGTYSCGTGDSFVTQQDPWLVEQNIDVVDMELYAIAAVAHAHGLPWISYKYVTDQANDSAGQDWSAKVNHGEALFLEQLYSLL